MPRQNKGNIPKNRNIVHAQQGSNPRKSGGKGNGNNTKPRTQPKRVEETKSTIKRGSTNAKDSTNQRAYTSPAGGKRDNSKQPVVTKLNDKTRVALACKRLSKRYHVTRTLDLVLRNREDNQSEKKEHDDRFQESLLRRLWIALVSDLYDETVSYRLGHWMNQRTLLQNIVEAQATADFVLYGGDRPENVFALLLDNTDMESAAARKKLLQVLRFPKRYTPNGGVGTNTFWDTNKRLEVFDFHSCENIYSLRVKEVLAEWLADYKVDEEQWSLSSGATLDHDRDIVGKLLSAEQVFPDLLGPTLGTPWWNLQHGTKVLDQVNRMKTVPKNYKANRNIAIEPQWISVAAGPVAAALERACPAFVHIRCQDFNRELARRGSIDNSLVTTDLSAASDSNSIRWLEKLLPPEVYKDILRVTSRHPKYPKDKTGIWDRRRWDPAFGWLPYYPDYRMISTMGNRVTFPLECLIFAAILETVARMHGAKAEIHNCGVVGDDLIYPREWHNDVVELLTHFGYLVNEEKTFSGTEFFRESCGGEYFHGEDISSFYWPRKPINRDINSVPSLVSLQHQMVNFPHCDVVLQKAIRELCPKMTESYVGSQYTDIWSYYPVIKRAAGSYAAGISEPEMSCEVHTTFEPLKGETGWNPELDRYNYYRFLKFGHRDHEDPILAAIGYPADKDATWGAVHPSLTAKNRKYLV